MGEMSKHVCAVMNLLNNFIVTYKLYAICLHNNNDNNITFIKALTGNEMYLKAEQQKSTM